MRAIDAAATVLAEAKGPLHYIMITERMIAQGLWDSEGKTPEATVNARLAVDIRDQGTASRFVRVGRGRFALNAEKDQGQDRGSPSPASARGGDGRGGSASFTDAAERVLAESPDRSPLHYAAITERALERDLIHTEGRTPSATMYSQILTDIRRRETRGEAPRFVQHGRGMVGLAAWLPVEVAGLVEKKNREVRQALLERAGSASPAGFERLVGELLSAMGFEDIEVTRTSNDGGVDLRGTLVVGDTVRIRMAVQAKRWKANVQAPIVQQVRGSLGAHEQGLIVTTSDFSRGAREEALRPDAAPVGLMDGQQFAALLAKHQIGARIQPYELYALADDEGSEG
ncbi:MAG: restriction endonuclease [Chloroflexi bacterium]|nr:restriction endonuclease [Chloroflexota bacterium]MYB83350.1 restriction endonuclease [Chloroflexota bacterium]